MREIIDTLDDASRRIFEDRKHALEKDDEAMAQQIGEGRDIMSILRTFTNESNAGLRLKRPSTVKANLQTSGDDQLTEAELLGQMSYVPPPRVCGRF